MAKILEKGDIYFFARPKADVWEVASLEEIEHLYLVLKPQENEIYRLFLTWGIKLPKNKEESLPLKTEIVAREPQEIVRHLESRLVEVPEERKVLKLEAARPVGEGRYGLVKHEDQTQLVYLLELPDPLGQVQLDLGLTTRGGWAIAVKNPGRPSEGFLELKDSPPFPGYLMANFDGKEYVGVTDQSFFNYPNAEFLVTSVGTEISEINLTGEREDLSSAEIFNDLKVSREDYPLKPLLKGEWD